MPNLHIDIETYSTADLRRCGVYEYASHPDTEVLCVAYGDGHEDGLVRLWVPVPAGAVPDEAMPRNTTGVVWAQPECPERLAFAMANCELHAYNALFERVMLNGPWARAHGVPATEPSQWRCTMAAAFAAGLPLPLKGAALALGTEEKDDAGRTVMLQVSKPKKPSKTDSNLRYSLGAHPKKFQALYEYCIDDVRAERGVSMAVPALLPSEQQLWEVDQAINDRGILVDRTLCHRALVAHEGRKAALDRMVRELAGVSVTQVQGLRRWLWEQQGVRMDDMLAQTVAEKLKADLPEAARTALSAYTEANMKAPAKFGAAMRASDALPRLRGMFVFNGAATGRWSSRIVQLQNLKRPPPGVSSDEIAARILEGWDEGDFDLFYPGTPTSVLSAAVRAMLCADHGCELVVCDLSQIEARVLQWGARHGRVLDLYRQGEDVYRHTAAQMFGVAVDDVTPEQRFNGKTGTLALGYQGGAAAFAKMAQVYGVEVPPDTAEGLKLLWREANGPVVKFWNALANAAIHTVEHGVATQVGGCRAEFRMEDAWLTMRLPSGRRLRYYRPSVEDGLGGRPSLVYQGLDTYTRKWGAVRTYGGRLAENWTQATARDVLAESIRTLHCRGVDVLGHVHDEVICQAPSPDARTCLREVERVMSEPPAWADGLPVDCAGYTAPRYRKD